MANIFGMVAMEAAYSEGEEWLEQLLDYLQGNLEFLIEFVNTRIPKIKVIKPEGTYLVWFGLPRFTFRSRRVEVVHAEKS